MHQSDPSLCGHDHTELASPRCVGSKYRPHGKLEYRNNTHLASVDYLAGSIRTQKHVIQQHFFNVNESSDSELVWS